jgi:hypothetical protein
VFFLHDRFGIIAIFAAAIQESAAWFLDGDRFVDIKDLADRIITNV